MFVIDNKRENKNSQVTIPIWSNSTTLDLSNLQVQAHTLSLMSTKHIIEEEHKTLNMTKLQINN